MEALLQKLAEGTRAGYEGGWRLWAAYRRAQREERLRDEEALITFCVILSRGVGRTEGTIKQKLFAVRYAHRVAGYSDPLLHRGRLWSTLAGLKRWQGPAAQRKKPVTPKMLLWLKAHIHTKAGLSSADAATLWAAISLAFFFLLRASEYLVNDRSWSAERVVNGEDLEAMCGGQRVASFAEADEAILYFSVSDESYQFFSEQEATDAKAEVSETHAAGYDTYVKSATKASWSAVSDVSMYTVSSAGATCAKAIESTSEARLPAESSSTGGALDVRGSRRLVLARAQSEQYAGDPRARAGAPADGGRARAHGRVSAAQRTGVTHRDKAGVECHTTRRQAARHGRGQGLGLVDTAHGFACVQRTAFP